MFPIRIFPANTHWDFLGKKWWAFSFSAFLFLGSILLLIIRGLNFGIDFTGGIVIEIRTEQPVNLAEMRSALSNQDLGDVSLQYFGSDQDVLIRLPQQEGEEGDQNKVVEKVKTILAEHITTSIDYRKVDFVGPQVGQELIRAGFLSLALAFAAIMVYIWLRFEWQFGIGGIMALVHDAVITMGFYSLFWIEFNLTSVAAILTIIGYSINDSVVIYDRIREYLRKFKKMPFEELLNESINSTLSRTVLTGGSTLLAILALILFGGEVIKGFSFATFFGIVIGTYSSIYISAPVLIFMNFKNSDEIKASA